MKKTMAIFLAAGVAGSLVGAAQGQTVGSPRGVVTVSGATLLQNFTAANASTNDFIDVDGNLLAGALGTFPPPQLAPSAALPPPVSMPLGVLYRSVGSINGLIELLNFGVNGVDTAAPNFTDAQGPGQPNDPAVTLVTAPINRGVYNRTNYITNSTGGAGFNLANPGAAPIRMVRNSASANFNAGIWTSAGTPSNGAACPGNPGPAAECGWIRIDIAVVDVPSVWAFQVPGTPSQGANPGQAGYGTNPRLGLNKDGTVATGVNTSQLPAIGIYNTNVSSPNSLTLFDTPISYAPIGAMANPGLGLQQIEKTNLAHAFGTGRLKSGENIMVVTRDVGSGTRNAWQNSIGQDPGFGVGENIGAINSNQIFDRVGPDYIPTNKGSNSRIETTVFNTRLGLGYVGVELGANTGWLIAPDTTTNPQLADWLAVRNDNAGGTEFSRPEASEIVDNGVNGYRIGGPAVFITIGDPRSADDALGGSAGNSGAPRGWPAFNWDRDPRDPAVKGPRPANEAINTNPDMRNPFAAAYINNVTRSAERFTSIPTDVSNVGSPGELLALEFALTPSLDFVPTNADPKVLIPNPVFNAALQEYVRENAIYSASRNPRYATFNANATGRLPDRTQLSSGTYNDGRNGANTFSGGGGYRTEGGAGLDENTRVPARNRIAGDFDGNGQRNINDAQEMVRALRQVEQGEGTFNWVPLDGIYGAGAGNDAIIHVLGDFNCDGNFNRADLRYFADGLAVVPGTADGVSFTNKLNRKQGFIAVETQFASVFGVSAQSLFGTTLANPNATYDAGDSRGDVIGTTGRVTRGFAPIGQDGAVNALDIDYVYNQFKRNPNVTGDAEWSNLDEAVSFDLSADMTGDLIVNQDDVNEIVVTILETTLGDVNLDGVTTWCDLRAARSNLGGTGGWATGNVDGDGSVTQADLDQIYSNITCLADWDCNGEVEPLDITAFFADFRAGEADVDNNGETEPLDIQRFFAEFRAGC